MDLHISSSSSMSRRRKRRSSSSGKADLTTVYESNIGISASLWEKGMNVNVNVKV